MTDLGFKNISPENWLKPDPMTQDFAQQLEPDMGTRPLSGEELLHEIFQPQLSPSVPLEIRKLFEVARGAMVYGYYFYPLFSLAIEQLYRVLEAAVINKCNAMGVPHSRDSYAKKVDWLIEQGVISQDQSKRWIASTKLRNFSSHPEMQSIYMPLEALKSFEILTDQINKLFAG
jgi:hypothetical protein